MKKQFEIGPLVKFLIFLLILGGIIYFLFVAIDSSKKETDINEANKKADKIYQSAQDWLSSNSRAITNVKLDSGQTLVFISTSGNNKKANAVSNGSSIATMDMDSYFNEFMEGNWVVVINKEKLTVEYALWCREKLTQEDIKELPTIKSQRQVLKDKKKVIGYSSNK